MKCGSIVVPNSSILFIAEAPGAEEEKAGLPLIGRSGREFDSMLMDAGIERGQVSITNIFDERPPDNDLNAWSVSRKAVAGILATFTAGQQSIYRNVPCKSGVVDPQRTLAGIERVKCLLESLRPNVIVALGNTPLAALTGNSGITKFRGTILQTHLTNPATKVLPTYHPAGVMRQYEWRTPAVADLMKAKVESGFPELRLKNRQIWIEPTTDDLVPWADQLCQAEYLAVDIETKAGQITCIGFAPSDALAFVIPFWIRAGNYWRSVKEELLAWRVVQRILRSPSKKIFQNGVYDISYLDAYGILVNNFAHDTMLLHHALYPELPKSLGFLGSIYCNERAWKKWRVRGGDTNELKKDE